MILRGGRIKRTKMRRRIRTIRTKGSLVWTEKRVTRRCMKNMQNAVSVRRKKYLTLLVPSWEVKPGLFRVLRLLDLTVIQILFVVVHSVMSFLAIVCLSFFFMCMSASCCPFCVRCAFKCSRSSGLP